MKCKVCGAEVDDKAKFCTACGTKTAVDTGQDNSGQQPVLKFSKSLSSVQSAPAPKEENRPSVPKRDATETASSSSLEMPKYKSSGDRTSSADSSSYGNPMKSKVITPVKTEAPKSPSVPPSAPTSSPVSPVPKPAVPPYKPAYPTAPKFSDASSTASIPMHDPSDAAATKVINTPGMGDMARTKVMPVPGPAVFPTEPSGDGMPPRFSEPGISGSRRRSHGPMMSDEPDYPPVKEGAVASCMRCGATIPADRLYCDRCSILEEEDDVEGGEKKGHTGLIIGIIIGVLVLILGVIAFMFRDKIFGLFGGGSSSDMDYDKANSKLCELIEDEDFINASADERREMAEDVLDELEKDELVNGSSVNDSDSRYLYFELSNGTECFIQLEDPASESILGAPVYSNSIIRSDAAHNRYMSYPKDIANVKDPYEEGTQKAVFINGINSTDLDPYASDWSKCHLETTVDSQFTVERLKTELSDYNYVNFYCHGYLLTCNNMLYIRLNEEVTSKNLQKYDEELSNGRTAIGYFPGEVSYLIKPVFFEHYYSDGKLKNTILWISSCYSMATDELERSLATSECKALVGFDGINEASYDRHMQDTAIYYTMKGESVFNAVTKAMTDLEREGQGLEGSSIRFLGDKKAHLFTLTDDAMDQMEVNSVRRGNVVLRMDYTNGKPVSAMVSIFREGADSNDISQAVMSVDLKDGTKTFSLEEGRYFFTAAINSEKVETSVYDIAFEDDGAGGLVDYIVPTIVVEVKESYPEMVNAVYDNISKWVNEVVDTEKYSDDFNFWFQDMNMDGNVDFVVGPVIKGAHEEKTFFIWEYNNGKFEKSTRYNGADTRLGKLSMTQNFGQGTNLSCFSGYPDYFYFDLYKNNSTGKYIYCFPAGDGDSNGSARYIGTVDCSSGKLGTNFTIELDKKNKATLHANGALVDLDKFKSEYNKFKNDYQYMLTSAYPISYSSIKKDSKEKWMQELAKSYNAWEYSGGSGNGFFDSNVMTELYQYAVEDEEEDEEDDDDGYNNVMYTGVVRTKTNDNLNIRKNPSTNSDIIGELKKDKKVDVYAEVPGDGGTWCVVKTNDGKIGYASKDFIFIE